MATYAYYADSSKADDSGVGKSWGNAKKHISAAIAAIPIFGIALVIRRILDGSADFSATTVTVPVARFKTGPKEKITKGGTDTRRERTFYGVGAVAEASPIRSAIQPGSPARR
jgi:hypothetical protein